MKKERIWTKDFMVLMFGNFTSAITFYLLMTSIAVYTEYTFNTNKGIAGFTVGIFLIGSLFSRLFAGRYMDIIGRKKLLIIGTLTNLIIVCMYFFINSIALLLVVRILHGFSFGIVTTVYLAVGIASVPDARKGEGTAYFSLSIAAGTAIGPFLALMLLERYSYNALFFACAIFSFFSFVATLAARMVESENPMLQRDAVSQQKKATRNRFSMWNFIEKKVLPIAFIMLIGGVSYSSIISFINTFALEINLTKPASLFFVVYAVFLFVSRPLAGRLYDRRGENIVVIPSIIMFSLCFVCMVFTYNGVTMLIAAAFLAFGYGTLMSTFQALVVKISPQDHIGMAISTYYISLDVGNGVGGYFIGSLVDLAGFRVMYMVVACLIVFMIPIYWIFHGRKFRRNIVSHIEGSR